MIKYELSDVEDACAQSVEVAFALLASGIAEKERMSVPLLGHATDRRALRQLGEVFAEDTSEVLMCFICGSKYLEHKGFDKFGESQEKGEISFRTNDHSCDKLHRILTADKKSNFDEAWRYNFSYDYFQTRFGAAVRTDPSLSEDCYEWRRKLTYCGQKLEIICNPEDVRSSRACTHNAEEICTECAIPVCNSCWQLAGRGEKIPRALANDNFIGYVHNFFVVHDVTWIEAQIACPIFSSLVTYYIEGDFSQKHHLMEAVVGKPERAYGVRGNLFSCLLPWEWIQEKLASFFEERISTHLSGLI